VPKIEVEEVKSEEEITENNETMQKIRKLEELL
jgi:hypothetical protein